MAPGPACASAFPLYHIVELANCACLLSWNQCRHCRHHVHKCTTAPKSCFSCRGGEYTNQGHQKRLRASLVSIPNSSQPRRDGGRQAAKKPLKEMKERCTHVPITKPVPTAPPIAIMVICRAFNPRCKSWCISANFASGSRSSYCSGSQLSFDPPWIWSGCFSVYSAPEAWPASTFSTLPAKGERKFAIMDYRRSACAVENQLIGISVMFVKCVPWRIFWVIDFTKVVGP